ADLRSLVRAARRDHRLAARLDFAHAGNDRVVGGAGAALQRAAGGFQLVFGDIAPGDGLAHARADRAAGEQWHGQAQAHAIALVAPAGRLARHVAGVEITPLRGVAVIGTQGDARQVLGAGGGDAVARGAGVVF